MADFTTTIPHTTTLQEVYLPLITNPRNQEVWSEMVLKEGPPQACAANGILLQLAANGRFPPESKEPSCVFSNSGLEWIFFLTSTLTFF